MVATIKDQTLAQALPLKSQARFRFQKRQIAKAMYGEEAVSKMTYITKAFAQNVADGSFEVVSKGWFRVVPSYRTAAAKYVKSLGLEPECEAPATNKGTKKTKSRTKASPKKVKELETEAEEEGKAEEEAEAKGEEEVEAEEKDDEEEAEEKDDEEEAEEKDDEEGPSADEGEDEVIGLAMDVVLPNEVAGGN